MIIDKVNLFNAIDASIEQAMEDLVFMEVEHCRSDEGLDVNVPGMWSKVRMQEPIQGQVTLWMPMTLISEIMNSIFDIPSEISYDPELAGTNNVEGRGNFALEDAINEVVNTLGGLLMNQLVSSDQQYLIGLPEAQSGHPVWNEAVVRCYKMNKQVFWIAVEGVEIE